MAQRRSSWICRYRGTRVPSRQKRQSQVCDAMLHDWRHVYNHTSHSKLDERDIVAATTEKVRGYCACELFRSHKFHLRKLFVAKRGGTTQREGLCYVDCYSYLRHGACRFDAGDISVSSETALDQGGAWRGSHDGKRREVQGSKSLNAYIIFEMPTFGPESGSTSWQ